MVDVSAEARIEAPPARVWAHLTDFSAHGRWSATHTSFPRGGPAPLEAGAAYTENMKLMGFPAEVAWTVEEVVPDRSLAIKGKGPMGVTVGTRYTLTPDGDATVMRIDGAFTGAAVAMMAAKLTESATAALEESLRRLGALAT
ncbi:SRPBCC family protein [Streptomyces sp. NPDC057638]|uniref:type II toxin-antitoxin system Rv0910 family toxin n=1 Tax=Streptomyces sp. NPDC057638 TaxID=3346190 RepID=UPI0036920B34